MTLLDRLKGQILWDRKNSLYDIWEGCHENMLVDMAIDSHVSEWKDDYVKGGWTKEGVCADRLNDLYNYYCMWLYINKDIELR